MEQIGNMRRVNHEELKELILKYYKVKRSLMTWGTIGIGKSDTIRDTAMMMSGQYKLEFSDGILNPKKFSFVDVRLATMGPEDVKGIPFPFKICTKCNNHLKMDDTKCKCGGTNLTVSTVWLLPDWFPRDPDSRGILFFDEITNATPIVQHASYTIIRDRKIGNVRLPDGWMVISAGNRVEDMSNVFEMSKALENRFGHAELLTPNIKDWKEWALKHGVDTSIVAFLLWRPDRLMMFKPSDMSRADLKEKAFATPRTWEYASDLVKGESVIDKMEMFIATAVGNGIAMEWSAFWRLRQKIRLSEIIREPERIKELDNQEDMLYTVICLLADWYKTNSEKQHLQRICQIAEYMRAEFAILLLRLCKREHDKSFQTVIKDVPEWKNTLAKKYSPYV